MMATGISYSVALDGIDGRVVTVGALQPGSLSWLLVRFRG